MAKSLAALRTLNTRATASSLSITSLGFVLHLCFASSGEFPSCFQKKKMNTKHVVGTAVIKIYLKPHLLL